MFHHDLPQGITGNCINTADNSDDPFPYREEVGELAVEELLQLALVEFVLVSIISGVVVENGYQRVHRALELSRHSAGRKGNGDSPAIRGRNHQEPIQRCVQRCSYLLTVARKCGKAPQCCLFISN